LPFCHVLRGGGRGAGGSGRRRRQIPELDVDVVLADHDPLRDVLDDLALLGEIHLRQPPRQVPGLGEHLVARQVLDLHEVDLGLQLRDAVLELPDALLERLVAAPEALRGDLPDPVQFEQAVHLGGDGLLVLLHGAEQFLLLGDRLLGLVEVVGRPVGREEEALELLCTTNLWFLRALRRFWS